MLRIGNHMIERLFGLLVEVLVVATGWRVLQLFGRKDPGELASLLAGLALRISVGLAVLTLEVTF